MSPHEIALALTPLACVLLTWPFVFVVLEKRYGPTFTLRVGICAFFLVNAAFPQLRYVRDVPPALWCALVVIGMCRGIGGNSAFPSLTIIVNSLLTGHLGAMNGFVASVGSAMRAISPLLCGSLFSAATAIEGAPAAQGLPFYVLCTVNLGGLWLTTRLPARPSGSLARA